MRGAWIATLVVALAGHAAQAENATVPYARLASMRNAFTALPAAQRDKIDLVLAMQHADSTNHAPIRMWVEVDGKRIEIPVTAEGVIALPERPDWAARDIAIQTDQPRHSLNLGIDMLIRPPAGEKFEVAYLLAAVQQANDAMRTGARRLYGYIASLAAPSAHDVVVTLARCCTDIATISGPAGSAVLKQDAAGKITIPMATLRSNADGTITTSAPVTVVDPFPN